MTLAQLDKILKNCRYFYGILGPFLCAKLSVWKFCCAKEFAFRRSAWLPSLLSNWHQYYQSFSCTPRLFDTLSDCVLYNVMVCCTMVLSAVQCYFLLHNVSVCCLTVFCSTLIWKKGGLSAVQCYFLLHNVAQCFAAPWYGRRKAGWSLLETGSSGRTTGGNLEWGINRMRDEI